MKPATLLLLFCVLLGCTVKKTTSGISEDKTKETLDHHWVAFQANDLEATMDDYTGESVLITPDRTYRGLTEIRENFVGAFAAFPKGSSTLVLEKSVVVNDVGYILWHAKTPAFTLSFATDTFIIQNGKIVHQTYAGVAN
ncbi:MAG: nuclear transport factor 2 family protein [Cyclobacteriaceae bacterium]